ncbi:MAG: hypothetical protein R6X11_01965 [Desulfonatronovibrio sp.]
MTFEVKYLFRKPKFPVICDVHGELVAAKTHSQFSKLIGKLKLPQGEQLPLLDARAENWVFVVDHLTISPLAVKKKWTKKEVIALFNNSKTAKENELEYSMNLLSAKRYEKILYDIVNMILKVK